MTGLVQDEKRIGCMSGFLQIFDRQQLLAGKRVHSTKRLLPSTDVGASPEIVSSVNSSKLDKNVETNNAKIQSKSPVSRQAKFELKDETRKCSGKTLKEMPRLSLDSRATFDSKGSLRTKDVSLKNSVSSATTKSVSVVADGDDKNPRSPSVIARLMGLESLSSPKEKKSSHSVARKPALQRSFSESRVKYIDNNNFQLKKPSQLQKQTEEIVVKDKHIVRSIKSESSKANSWRSRTVFDSDDFYPMSIEEQKNDLGTLKQILEVLQLKGLLHSTRPLAGHRNFVYDRNVPSEESKIVVVKPCRTPVSKVDNRSGRSSPVRGRSSSPNRIESNLKSCNSIVKRKPLSVEIRQRANELSDARSSPVKSPKVTPKRNGSSGHSSARIRSQSSQKRTESLPVYSPNRKLTKNIVTDDESSSISESTVSTPTTNEPEISKCEAFRDGKTLLQRCDKLLESIAEMNKTVESPPSPCIVLPSPVSVLDLGFDKDESLSPSHSIDFKATPSTQFEDGIWSHTMSPTKLTEHEEEFTSSDPDFIYISKILKSSHYLNEDSNAFLSIEKQLVNDTKDTSSFSKRHRKLVFDIIFEILHRNRQLPPWKMAIGDSGTSVKNIWYEYQKMQEVNTGDSLLDLISCVLKKDLLEINGWGDYLIERSEMVLDIERMVFKDLVSEAMRDFDEFSSRFMFSKAQRKLVF
ncbi:longifolia 1-like protein [Tanacetum coccineum]